MDTLLDQTPQRLVTSFLHMYGRLFRIDQRYAQLLIRRGKQYYAKTPTSGFVLQRALEKQWYAALDEGRIDYSCYAHPYYFTDLWICWMLYSRKYVRSIRARAGLKDGRSIFDLFANVPSVLDLGCGIAYTTAALKQLFSCARIVGTNVPNTPQYRFCKTMAGLYGFDLVADPQDARVCDGLVFASEYFEHILDAPDHLLRIITYNTPRFFFIANSFNTHSVGHFRTYTTRTPRGIITHDQTRISKVFNNVLRSCGYQRVETTLWNNKPALWIRNMKD